ncbi:hypothetical protein Bresu_1255 [Brevundimonas subvibrioides ATCC 15264]|uniref:Uncharacterized protein n=1 Tax=Brevundimonas subvibrioides (strain ATCC 15264 / DSM 4735 / LMG 14903 / NBRC 16000 / CB 81) TaxID=633149 RepID=D9QF82_BRESC|nr:hypothetical protein Bresu_1255 [Brevundimonas subvibrioides ATCC 15264]
MQAPSILDFGPIDDINALYAFFEELRFRTILLGQKVIVDLRMCRRVGAVGVLLLAAEIERCNFVKPDHVSGYSPTNPVALRTLSMFGFHQAIGVEVEESILPQRGVVQIQTGTGETENLSSKLGEVAGLTLELWHDQAFTDRIHGALNEAMTNVLMHAYDPNLTQNAGEACESGRWWVAGFSQAGSGEAWFLALDLGVGIPVSAPAKNKGLQAYLATPVQRNDAMIIWHVISQEGRSRTGLPQHGKGMPTMVSLIRDRAKSGTLWIVSGNGIYLLDKDATRPGERMINEMIIPLRSKAAGTLILWKVGRSSLLPAEA